MIVVFGSINADLVVAVPQLPGPGETVVGPDHQIFAGGKGANQALAAKRAGADVRFVGAVGDDALADAALANLVAQGVDLSGLHKLDGATGLAMITVSADGENQICVASGANRLVEAAWLEETLGADTHILLMQLELPLKAVLDVSRMARARGVTVMLNAAPADGVRAEMLAAVDVLVVNESEAAALASAMAVDPAPEAFAKAAVSSGCRLVVVTLGSDGCLAQDGRQVFARCSPLCRRGRHDRSRRRLHRCACGSP